MRIKKSQLIMVWFLPLMIFGGLFIPLLGYLLLAMMAFFLVLAVFKGRYWCWNLCPRGAFLDLAMAPISPGRKLPRLFSNIRFRWAVFFAFMGVLIFRLATTGARLFAIGAIFVSVCIITTILAIILGLTLKHRTWCVLCPMGTLQEALGRKGRRTEKL